MTHTSRSESRTTSVVRTDAADLSPGLPRFRDLIGIYALLTLAIPGALALAAHLAR